MTLELRKECLDQAITLYGDHETAVAAAKSFYEFLHPANVDTDVTNHHQPVMTKPPVSRPVAQVAPKSTTSDVDVTGEPAIEISSQSVAGSPSLGELKGKQAEILGVAIALHQAAVTVTVKAVFEGVEDLSEQGVSYALNTLVKKGYMACEKFNSKQNFYKPIYDANGAPLIKTEQSINADGQMITKCPPGYAYGYGLKQTIGTDRINHVRYIRTH